MCIPLLVKLATMYYSGTSVKGQKIHPSIQEIVCFPSYMYIHVHVHVHVRIMYKATSEMGIPLVVWTLNVVPMVCIISGSSVFYNNLLYTRIVLI